MTLAAQLRAQRAIDDVTNGRSLRAAFKIYQVEYTYLRRRIKDVKTRENYNETLQKLSKHQEDGLSKWIVIC